MTEPPIGADTRLAFAEPCVVRQQESEFLFYNPNTDELHLVPPSAFYLIRLCNGLRTVGEIEAMLIDAIGAPSDTVRERVRAFFAAMVARGLLVVDDA